MCGHNQGVYMAKVSALGGVYNVANDVGRNLFQACKLCTAGCAKITGLN